MHSGLSEVRSAALSKLESCGPLTRMDKESTIKVIMPDTLEVPKPPPLPPDPWKIEESEKQPIEILPQEVKGAINNLIKTIIAQETSPQGEVRMSPDRIDYYKK